MKPYSLTDCSSFAAHSTSWTDELPVRTIGNDAHLTLRCFEKLVLLPEQSRLHKIFEELKMSLSEVTATAEKYKSEFTEQQAALHQAKSALAGAQADVKKFSSAIIKTQDRISELFKTLNADRQALKDVQKSLDMAYKLNSASSPASNAEPGQKKDQKPKAKSQAGASSKSSENEEEANAATKVPPSSSSKNHKVQTEAGVQNKTETNVKDKVQAEPEPESVAAAEIKEEEKKADLSESTPTSNTSGGQRPVRFAQSVVRTRVRSLLTSGATFLQSLRSKKVCCRGCFLHVKLPQLLQGLTLNPEFNRRGSVS